MKKLTVLLVAAIFASPAFAEEAKVEAPTETVAAEATKAPEAALEEVKKEEAVAAAPEVKKEVKADKPAKKAQKGTKGHKKSKTAYTIVPEKKYTVVPAK